MTESKPILDSGDRSKFSSGAVRDLAEGKGRMDLLPVDAIFAIAKHYEAGCKKYGDRNWEKGIPLSRYLDSALRHTFKVLRGDDDENHLESAIWNLMCLLQTKEWVKQGLLPSELDDLPPQLPVKSARYLKATMMCKTCVYSGTYTGNANNKCLCCYGGDMHKPKSAEGK